MKSILHLLSSRAVLPFACLAIPAVSSAATLMVSATRTASPGSAPAGQDVDADNRLRAYAVDGLTIDGWMSFDVSALAAAGGPVVVTAASLTLFAEGNVAGSPFQSQGGSPQLGVWYSDHDGWDRGGGAFPSALTRSVLDAASPGPFPDTSRTAFDIALSVSPAVGWSAMVADGELSLVLRLDNDPAGANWIYWYGSGERPGDNTAGGNAGNDPVGPGGSGAFAPRLTLEYEVIPEPSAPALLAAFLAPVLFGRRRGAVMRPTAPAP